VLALRSKPQAVHMAAFGWTGVPHRGQVVDIAMNRLPKLD
jgi:hypothetical protein